MSGRIRRLAEGTINRIAAGEVVERPASAVKELVENAIDAGAKNVDITIAGGGMTLIRIADDGIGMSADELTLAVERHATSKLPRDEAGSDDLMAIATLGFRGEALPSIGAIARLTITSRAKGSKEAFAVAVEGGQVTRPRPAPFEGHAAHGTIVDVRDLSTQRPPASKFLKSERLKPPPSSKSLSALPWPAPTSASAWRPKSERSSKPRPNPAIYSTEGSAASPRF
jgi:DNA mismatch repair protein MutL